MPAPRKSGRARREFSAGGVVFRHTTHGPEFVLIEADGRWSLPKGNVEEGEKPEATALREISEETGLPVRQLRIVRPLPEVTYAFQWNGVLVFKLVYNFLVELTGDAPLEPQLSEIHDVRWFGPDAARRTISFKNSQATLEAAIAGLEELEQAS